jgi:hypothetical protein
MNYQEMSDEQIDLAVSEIIFGKKFGRRNYYSFDRPKFIFTASGHSFTPLDNENVVFTPRIKPTSSWADAGPIAQENKISVLFDGQGMCHATREAYWVDGTEWQIDGIVDENPCRAICIVFLMMKGGE